MAGADRSSAVAGVYNYLRFCDARKELLAPGCIGPGNARRISGRVRSAVGSDLRADRQECALALRVCLLRTAGSEIRPYRSNQPSNLAKNGLSEMGPEVRPR